LLKSEKVLQLIVIKDDFSYDKIKLNGQKPRVYLIHGILGEEF